MYSNRIVAFIDMLGTTDKMLSQTVSFEEAFGILNRFENVIQDFDGHFSMQMEMFNQTVSKSDKTEFRFDGNKMNITFFSDNVVWSYPIDEVKIKYELFIDRILSFFHLVQTVFLQDDIMTRGGVSIGDLHQQGNKVFGVGLVFAHLGEQKANYPRILIDKKIIDKCELKFVHFFDKFISYDKRVKHYYIDIFKYLSFRVDLMNRDKQFAETLQSATENEVSRFVKTINKGLLHKKIKVRLKYFWLYQQANKYSNLKPFIKSSALVKLNFFQIKKYQIAKIIFRG